MKCGYAFFFFFTLYTAWYKRLPFLFTTYSQTDFYIATYFKHQEFLNGRLVDCLLKLLMSQIRKRNVFYHIHWQQAAHHTVMNLTVAITLAMVTKFCHGRQYQKSWHASVGNNLHRYLNFTLNAYAAGVSMLHTVSNPSWQAQVHKHQLSHSLILLSHKLSMLRM